MNPKNWTYKQRNIALLAGAVLLLVVGYVAAFGKTYHLLMENRRLEAQSHIAGNVDEQILFLKKRLSQLEAFYASTNVSATSHHEEILKQVSSFCQQNNLLVREFPPAVHYDETKYLIETNQVTVEGSFKDIVRLVYNLEQVNKAGRVATVSFEAGPDRKTRQYRLAANIVLHNIKPKGNEQ